MMNILGINIGHNSSLALVSNGKLVLYLEEERLSRIKRDAYPYELLKKYLKSFNIDQINFTGTGRPIENSSIFHLLNKMFNFSSITPYVNQFYYEHHLCHAYGAFINSGFNEANNIVIDYGGTSIGYTQESESIFYIDKINGIQSKTYENHNDIMSNTMGITKTYAGIGSIFNIDVLEGGKLMGLSSYGEQDSTLPDFFINGKSNPNLFMDPDFLSLRTNLKYLNIKHLDSENNLKSKNLTQREKNIAYKVQFEAQREVEKLILKLLEVNFCKNITLSGGFGLNCVNNYYLKNKFPDINFYIEPISHDGGTAIGAAYLGLISEEKNMPPELIEKKVKGYKNLYSNKLNSLYLGPKYSKEELLEGIKKYVDN